MLLIKFRTLVFDISIYVHRLMNIYQFRFLNLFCTDVLIFLILGKLMHDLTLQAALHHKQFLSLPDLKN